MQHQHTGLDRYGVSALQLCVRAKLQLAPTSKTRAMTVAHKPVMLEQALAGLALAPDSIVIDATFGRGGHSAAILREIPNGALHAFDQDPDAVIHGSKLSAQYANFMLHDANFSEMKAVMQSQGLLGKVNAVLMDLGVSSPQFDTGERGFSFQHEGPLDMRMDPRSGNSVADWLNSASQEEIADVLWQYGEERQSRRIARAIVADREKTPIVSTRELAGLITRVMSAGKTSKPGKSKAKIHPATRSFQAMRIFINRELDVLQSALTNMADVLAPGGRLAIISFHSLEDRIVKQFIRGEKASGELNHVPASLRVAREMSVEENRLGAEMPQLSQPFRQVSRAFPFEAEVAENPRSRSAVLRVAERRP